MRFVSMLTAGALAMMPALASAQVSGTIVIGGGPVGGVIRIGEPRVVVVDRHPPPRIIVVERWHGRYHRGFDHRRAQRRVVFFDRRHNVYYDRYRPGLIEIRVFAFGGRWYQDDGRFDRYDRRRDRWDDRDRARARGRDRGWDGRDRDWDDRGDDRDRRDRDRRRDG